MGEENFAGQEVGFGGKGTITASGRGRCGGFYPIALGHHACAIKMQGIADDDRAGDACAPHDRLGFGDIL